MDLIALYTQILILSLGAISPSCCYPSGPPTTVCGSMMPSHGFAVQSTTAPFDIIVSSSCYKSGDTLNVEIRPTDGMSFKGFFVQARMGSSAFASYGTFQTDDIEQKQFGCFNLQNNAISHSARGAKSSTKFKWTPSPGNQMDITFTATVVRHKSTFWTNVKSNVINYNTSCALTTTPTTTTTATTTTTITTTTTSSTTKATSEASSLSPLLYSVVWAIAIVLATCIRN